MQHFLGTSLIFGTLGLPSRRLKVLHFLGKPLLPPLKVPHFPGKISVSRPLLQKSQSATFPWDISDFGTLGLPSRRLKVLHFLGKPLLPSLKVPHFPGNISVSRPLFPASQSATFPREIYEFFHSGPLLQKSRSAAFPREISDFGTLALSSQRLKVLYFLGKSIVLGLWPSLPGVSKCYVS